MKSLSNKKFTVLIIISLLMLSTSLSLINSGLQSFFQYQKSAYPRTKISLDLVHFFIKQNIKQFTNKTTIQTLPEKTNIDSFWLYADEKEIDQLDSDLPRSGKTLFISGHMRSSLQDEQKKVKLRYRGGLPFHWLYDKKSFRIKLNDYDDFNGDQQFNLVAPSTKYTIVDSIAYDISRKKGLITPDYYPTRVFINNQYNGLHYYLSQTDESLIRKQQRMPGSIYSGDNFYDSELKGLASQIFYNPKTFLPSLWSDQILWDKKAARNSESKNDRSDIEKFIKIVNQKDPVIFYKQFNQYFDIEKYFTYFAIDTYFGSHHHDYFHNHKLYVDPYKGKFEPIEWDVRFWKSTFKIKDTSVYPLIEQIQKNPLLEHLRDIVGYRLTNEYSIDAIKKIIDNKFSEINADLLADPYKRYQTNHYIQFSEDKSVLLTNQDYLSAKNQLIKIAKSRLKFLQALYSSSEVQLMIKQVKPELLKISLSVNNNSAITIDWQPILGEGMTITPIFEQKTLPDRLNTLLYPGRKLIEKFTEKETLKILGNGYTFPSPLHYTFQISGISLTNFKAIIDSLKVSNAITGEKIHIQVVDELPSDDETISIHPWKFNTYFKENKTINLSGVVNVMEDTVYDSHQTVNIQPGTIFRIAPEKSLFFYGKVIAQGNPEAVIHFRRQKSDKAWGSLVIQGQGASGSKLSHIKLSGGSVTSHRLIYYPGQFNIHDVSDFYLSHCHIANNSVGDDALHIAYSTGTISSCVLKNTVMDALDIDISTVEVKDSTFINSGNDGIDVMNSSVTITNNYFNGSGDKCLSIGEGARAKIINNTLNHCQIGIAIKDSSTAELHDVRFITKANPSITLYQKNARYSKGGSISGDAIYGITMQDIKVSINSSINFPENAFKPLTKETQ